MNDQMIIDMERINLITGGDKDLIQELASLFISDSTVRVDGLRAQFAAGDRVGLRKQAHAVKGASVNMGAQSLYEACHELEKTAETATAEELAGTIARIESTMAATAEVFRSL